MCTAGVGAARWLMCFCVAVEEVVVFGVELTCFLNVSVSSLYLFSVAPSHIYLSDTNSRSCSRCRHTFSALLLDFMDIFWIHIQFFTHNIIHLINEHKNCRNCRFSPPLEEEFGEMILPPFCSKPHPFLVKPLRASLPQ